MKLHGEVFEEMKRASTRSFKIKLKSKFARNSKSRALSGVPKLNKKISLIVEGRWRPGQAGSVGSLSFLLHQAAGIPVIRGARHLLAIIQVVDSSEGFARLISGSADKTAAIWDVWTGARLQIFRGHTADITQVLVADKYGQQLLFSGSRDKVRFHAVESRFLAHGSLPDLGRVPQTIRMWSIDTGECLRCIEAAAPVNAVSHYLHELEGKRNVDASTVLNPCKILVKLTYDYDSATNQHSICATVTKGQHVPKMDSVSGIDSYLVAQLGEESERSATAVKSMNPAWNLVTMFSPSNLNTPLLVKVFRC